MNAAPTDVIQRTTKPNFGLLFIVETVDDKAVIAYVPCAPERYRIAHDNYAVIGPAAVMNPMAIVTVPEKAVAAPRRNGSAEFAAPGSAPPIVDGSLPPPIPPPQGRRQPFGRFVRPGYNPDVLPGGDGAPIQDERPSRQAAQLEVETIAPPLPQPSPPPPPIKPPKKRRILDVEI